LDKKKEMRDLDSVNNKDSSYESPPHGNREKFSPTLLALAIAPHPTAPPKQRQEPNHPALLIKISQNVKDCKPQIME
jgi:hypothetical protein